MGGHRISRGTFAFMAVAGFSVNMLTLFALVLVIGTVVDDSIVVVEAVQARFDAGYRSAYKASVDAMNGLTSALFTTTLVFMVIFIPLAVILGVPFGLMGALLFAQLFGVQNNIYLQVGLIMLIGLLCKTAILLTEYATQCRQAGMSLKQSAFFAAKMRLRPIFMTSLTMIFGMLPLMFASGAGANGSRTVGVGTVGGMLIGTLGLLFVVPALFVIFQTLQERFKPVEFQPSDDPLIIEEMKKIEEYT